MDEFRTREDRMSEDRTNEDRGKEDRMSVRAGLTRTR